MKSLKESIIGSNNAGIESKIREFLAKYTNLTSSGWELDKNGFINVLDSSLIFIEGSEKIDRLPQYIKFGDVKKGVYSIPRCHWKSFEGFPKRIGTDPKLPYGRFLMSTESDTIDYMPEIVIKDPHAKYPIEVHFLKGIKKCTVDIPGRTMLYCDKSLTPKEVDDLVDILLPHTLGNVFIRVKIKRKTNRGTMKIEEKELLINKEGIL